jgi:hypothetical protein
MSVASPQGRAREPRLDAPTHCRFHYRAPVAICTACGCGLCRECTRVTADGPLCVTCVDQRDDEEQRRRMRREDGVALRRAGFAVPLDDGSSVLLRRDPLRLALPVAGALALAIGVGVLGAVAQVRAGVDALLMALLLAALLGLLVRILFGGVSRVAGLTAAAVTALAAAAGRWFAGDGISVAGAPLLSLRSWTDRPLGNHWVVTAVLTAAAFVAYTQAAGHKLA